MTVRAQFVWLPCVWIGMTVAARADNPAGAETRTVTPARALAEQFIAAEVAYGRGDDVRAAHSLVEILEVVAAGRADPAWGSRLGSAAAARLSSLLPDVAGQKGEATALEARILRLPPERFSWPARLILAEIDDRVARRRGDPVILSRAALRSGCVGRAQLLGTLGKLPHLDLEIDAAPQGLSRDLAASGCRLLLPALEGEAGVRALAAEFKIPVPGGEYVVVLDHSGPASLRVDGGSWQRHLAPDVGGSRAAAVAFRLAPGVHRMELRVGTYGTATDFALLVFARTPLPSLSAPSGGFARVALLADAVIAQRVGDQDRALDLATHLAADIPFAPGLLAAADILASDTTRPSGMARESARALLRQAVANDPKLARAWRQLAVFELDDDKAGEAVQDAERAVAAAPQWTPGLLTLADAQRERGFDRDAQKTLARAVTTLDQAHPAGACLVWEAAYRNAQRRAKVDDERIFANAANACDAMSEVALQDVRLRGDVAGLEAGLRRRLSVGLDRARFRADLAAVLLARGQKPEAIAELEALSQEAPRDATAWVRRADVLIAGGDRDQGVAVLAQAALRQPTNTEIRHAMRALGLASPLAEFRRDASERIAAFDRSKRRYDAPAVMILDRTVERVFPSGARATLTHNIVRVQSKDAIDRWGEVAVPEGAEVLAVRTRKSDGTVREPEDISGKATISAPELAIGDCVEWETLEFHEPVEAWSPGFLSERFYFQSLELPLDRSEYWIVAPAGMALDVDRRASAPRAVAENFPGGLTLTKFEAEQMPQLFAERAAVPVIEWIPSVRISSGVTMARWTRALQEQLLGVTRANAEVRQVARTIVAGIPGDRVAVASAIARWVTEHIETAGDLFEPATVTLARGRGNRAALMVALARAAGLSAHIVLARSRALVPQDAPVVPQELDDFAEILVNLDGVMVDPRLRRAPSGYLLPALNAAPGIGIGSRAATRTRGTVADSRSVYLWLRVGTGGAASGTVVERLFGWPAIEWAEIQERAGGDRAKLRQEFEQRWLGQQFSGARLVDLSLVSLPGPRGGMDVRYTFTHPQLAMPNSGELRLLPTFFRAQPGRRYASEESRKTAIALGFDVPLDLLARIDGPAGSKISDAGRSGDVGFGDPATSAARFIERREGRGGTVILRRQSRLPLVRIAPAEYPGLANRLRQVDATEQGEIRFALPPR